MGKNPNAAKRRLNHQMRVARLEVIQLAVNQKTSLEQLRAMVEATKK